MVINKIYNESCLDTMKKLTPKTVDLVMTSPPYNMTKRKGGISDTGKYDVYQDWKTEQEYLDFTISVFNGFDQVVVDNGVVLYNFSYSVENPSLPYKMIAEIEYRTNWTLVDTIIWKKKTGLPFPANRCRLSRNWEYIFVFARKNERNTYNIYKKVKSVSEKTGQKYYETIYNFVTAKNNDGKTHKLNQATYSTELCSKLFKMYSKFGDLVYDPFMGTGTTAVACLDNNLNFIGSEISEEQCNYAKDRITQKNSIFESLFNQ